MYKLSSSLRASFPPPAHYLQMKMAALPKNFNFCFPVLKRTLLSPATTSTATPSPEDLHRPSSTSQPPYFNSYNSLYQINSTLSESDHSTDENDDNLLHAAASTPDFATAYASHRFFFSSPGRSNSIVDSSSSESEPCLGGKAASGGVAVQKYSPDPYADFRRSMEEMVEARGLHDVGDCWKSLHDLLICYLSLNPKPTHKFIITAFADIIVSLMASSPKVQGDGCPEFWLPPGGVALRVRGCSCD